MNKDFNENVKRIVTEGGFITIQNVKGKEADVSEEVIDLIKTIESRDKEFIDLKTQFEFRGKTVEKLVEEKQILETEIKTLRTQKQSKKQSKK